MRSFVALTRIHWLTHSSYRLNVVLSLVGLAFIFLPVYLVSGALQPVVAESIADEGETYFGFLITGMAVFFVVTASVQALPGTVASGITTGTLEALLATPTRLHSLMAGLVGYSMLWAGFKCGLLLLGFCLAGGQVSPGGILWAGCILALLVLAHLPFGIVAAAMILVFRTSGPLVPGLLAAFSLLGGVYYSTTVIPDVVRPLAAAVPLTYGLRAFRRSLLAGDSPGVLLPDMLVLGGFAAVLMFLAAWALRCSLRHARRSGSLAQY